MNDDTHPLKKWRKRAENWRPHPQVFGEFLSVGAHGMLPNGVPVGFLAHPETWVAWCEREPKLRALEVLR